MNQCLLTLFLMLTSYLLVSQELAHSLQDSFERIMAAEKDDSTLIRHIARYISTAPQIDDQKILSLIKKGKSLSKRDDDRAVLFDLYSVGTNKLAIMGYKESSKKLHQEIVELTSNFDTINVKYYSKSQLELARYDNEEGQRESALNRCNDVITIHKKIGPSVELSLAYNEKTIYYRNAGELDRALTYSDSAISIIKGLDDKRSLGNLYTARGRVYRALGENEKARADYLLAIDYGEQYDIINTKSVAYNNLGNIEHISGNYDNAIAYYMKSLEIKEKRNDIRGKAIAYHNIGAIKFDMKDWDGAMEDFDKSNELADSIDFKHIIVHTNLKVGNIYYEKGNYNTALDIHSEVLVLSQEINFKYGEISGYYRVGQDQLRLGQYQEASLSLLEALRLAEKHGNKPLESSVLIALSELYMKTQECNASIKGSEILKNVNVENLLLQAKNMSDEMNIADNRLDVMSSLHNYYYTNNEYKKDAAILNEYVQLKDSLFSDQMAESVADWQTKYKTAEQQKEILKLETANKIETLKSHQFKSLLISSVFIFILVSIFGYNYLKQKNRRKQAKQRELFRSKLSSDLHDDVGSILTGLAMQSELLSNFADENVKGSMEKLADMSRDAMTRMRDTVWAIDSRKDSFSDLIDRMLDFGKDLLIPKDIQLVLNSNLEKDDKKIEPELRQNLYLIFKEAITNVSKYSNGTKVDVHISNSKTAISMIVQDNGKIDPSNVRTSGTGTSNMIQRAKDLLGTTKISYDENGYRVEVVIPIK